MTADQYEPGAAAASGALLEEKVMQALRLREHLWIATAAWLVPNPGKAEALLLDRENLLVSPAIGCYICEEPYSKRIAHRRCSGKGKSGPAPMLPGWSS
ncbi:MAG: hypothetical protein ACREME_04335 [Gemmatimonadales bacterium]